MTTGRACPSLVIAALAPLLAASRAHAWEFLWRFVERNGAVESIIPDNTIDASNGLPRRIRAQFGVFDNPGTPAPAGGFVGWNVGTISVSGPVSNSDETRTPGRLSPFNFANRPSSNGDPPLPGGDPFTTLTDIDATLGTQSPVWVCGPDGQPPPMPGPRIRGLNEFVSVYEITIDPRADAASYTVTFAGSLIAATEWRIVGTPVPPDCNPEHGGDGYGLVTYAPFPTDPLPFTCTLTVLVPAPAAAPLLLIMLALARPRRRS